jgi:hypothetical protein
MFPPPSEFNVAKLVMGRTVQQKSAAVKAFVQNGAPKIPDACDQNIDIKSHGTDPVSGIMPWLRKRYS